MSKQADSKKPKGSHSKSGKDYDCNYAGPVMGPKAMVEKLIADKKFAEFIQKLLKAIEDEDPSNDASVEAAKNAKLCLNKYYTTKPPTNGSLDEMEDLNLSKDSQDALQRCTDRNFLIVVAANL